MDCDYENYLRKFPFQQGKTKLELKYNYDKELGKGSYGNVLSGFRKKDHFSVAIKVLPTNLIDNWYFSKTLKMNIPMEILLLSLASNIDGVISMIEYYNDLEQSEWYIVMERFAETIDLFNYICSEGFLTEHLASQIFYELTRIIIECHLRGILHRDIKEENILIDKYTKKIWLIDFGSGGLMNDDNHYSYNGTEEYAPPEWIKYGHYRGCQLESWSLGIVLYSMVCGRIPFEDNNEILSNTIKFPRKISNNCKELILKCIERDPKNRIQPSEILKHPWIIAALDNCDSGRASFDEAFQEASKEIRRCSCTCADNFQSFFKDDTNQPEAAIESINYNLDFINKWQLKVFSKSLSPDIKHRRFSLVSSEHLSNKQKTSFFKSISLMDLRSKQSDFDVLSDIQRDEDFGYEADIDDNFQNEYESMIYSTGGLCGILPLSME